MTTHDGPAFDARRDEPLEARFERQRARLFAIAYRMLATRADADDLVHECFLRWMLAQRGADAPSIDNDGAWLSTVMVRLCIDHQKSARVRREQYVGPWLPEPLPTSEADDPGEKTALAESVSTAFLLVLESLSPVERAVLLLHDVFEYEHDEVAQMLDRSAEACRQSLHRARERLRQRRPRFAPSKAEHLAVLQAFLQAISTGDVATLVAVFGDDPRVLSDSDGKATAALKPVTGADRSARLLIGLAKKGGANATLRLCELNGWPAIVLEQEGRIHSALSIETDGAKVFNVHIVRNPEKLARL